MGWSPKEEWRGDPEKWVDHKTFLDRANNPKVWRERYQKLDREAKRNIEQVQQATQRIIARDRETLRQRYQAEYRRLESERDDWIRYHAERGEADQATQKLHEYEQALQKTNNDFRTEVAQTQQQAPPAEAVAWRQNRPFDTDPEFAQAASFHASRVDKEMPDAPVSERLARIDEILAKRFPEHYPDAAKPADPPPKPKAPPADARQPDGVRMTPGGQTRSYASQLSAVERQMGQGFVKDGLYKNLEAYAKVLKAPESEDA
jgi:flagellar biosynthesis GTPase FlhF